MLSHVRKFLLLVVGACAYSIVFSGEPTLTNPLLSQPRLWCIGRFVFDRPVASEISNQRYEFRGEKLGTQYNVSLAAFHTKTEAREMELSTKQRINPVDLKEKTGHAWLEKAFSPVQNSRIFVFEDAVAKTVKLPFETEGYIFIDGKMFHTKGMIGSSAINRVEDIYNDTVRRIKARDNWSIPTESGFCFDGGIVTGSSTYTEEVSQSFALMPGRPALLLIQMRDAVDTDQQPLTRTLPQLRAQMDRMPGHYRILRQGKRMIAGMDAEEVLFELKEGDITSYRFYLLAPGDESTLAKPHTAIQLLLGASSPNLAPDQATSPVDEAGALQTWNTLLNSLRLRPGAV
jgi:hypothetical protein